MLACPSCAHPNNEAAKFCEECGTKLDATPVREERKVITALFCDLVGSTALGEQMDHEDVARLLERYQKLCRARIESHGGVIEKFIGDAVVGVFGVPAAHEDDPERALRAALRICSDVEASDLGIQVRIGVNTGEALVRLDVDPRSGVGFATGDTMNTTARLEAAAPVMGVAVGERTYAATRHAIAYEELPSVAAKGKAERLATWQATAPISHLRNERDATPFVGRELELQVLTGLFERSRASPATEFATIVAEPGLGKSRLVRELGRHVESVPDLVRWRVGHCLPYGEGIGFWALGEVVKTEAGILETDDQHTLAAKLEGAVTEADPQTKTWLIDRLAPLVGLETSTPAPEQIEAFTAWRRFLESLATQSPTVLILEDLHWADPGFVAFLEHLAERTAGLPLLVVATARPELEERHPSWPPGRRSSVLSLSPLGDDDVETLIRTSLPEATDELTQIVLDRAGGSPLYAEQLAAMLHETALPIAGAAIDEALIPQSIQALIAARIDALALEPKWVLMQASVVGKTFWAGAITALGDHPNLEATLSELVRREFCRPQHPSAIEGDAEFGFWHALVRDVAYAELTKVERARMHAGVARWIVDRTGEAMGEEAEIVVHHLDSALELAPSAPDLDTAPLKELLADALLAAGEAAMRTDAMSADSLLERAIGLLDGSSPSHARATGFRGRSMLVAGRPADAKPQLQRAFDVAVASRDFVEAIPLAGDLAAANMRTGHFEDNDPMLQRLLSELGSHPSMAKAHLLGMMATMQVQSGSGARAEELFAQGATICEELDIDLPGAMLNARGYLRIGHGDLGGEEDIRRAIRWFLSEGHPGVAADALWNLGAALADWIGVRADAISAEAIELCEARGVGDVNSLRLLQIFAAFIEGRWERLPELDELIGRARDVGNLEDESIGLMILANAELERSGNLPMADRLIELIESWDPQFWIAGYGGSILARSETPDVRAAGLALLHRVANHPSPQAQHSEEIMASVVAGDLELARRFASDWEDTDPPWLRADSNAGAGALAEAEGRLEQAAACYSVAIELWGELGLAGRLPRERIWLGRCLLRLGRTENGIEALTQARASCESLGASMRIAEIDEILSTSR